MSNLHKRRIEYNNEKATVVDDEFFVVFWLVIMPCFAAFCSYATAPHASPINADNNSTNQTNNTCAASNQNVFTALMHMAPPEAGSSYTPCYDKNLTETPNPAPFYPYVRLVPDGSKQYHQPR